MFWLHDASGGIGFVLLKMVWRPSTFWSLTHNVIIVFAMSRKCTIAPLDFELRRYSSSIVV